MGQIYTASCDCGYSEDEIHVGGSMGIIPGQKRRNYFPHYCPECKIMFSGDLLVDGLVCCEKCGSAEVLPYFDRKICKRGEDIPPRHYHTRSIVLNRGKCLCPACGEYSLSFESHISYD